MRGRGNDRPAGDAERRLRQLADRWRVPSAGQPVGGPRSAPGDGLVDDLVDDLAAPDDPGGGFRRPRLGPWTGSALRGIALLLVVAALVAAYWAWTGRPRAVALAPTTLATGAVDAIATDAGSAGGGGEEEAEPTARSPAAGGAEAPVEPSAAAVVVVHVTGQVVRPGLVELPAGSRVADAVAAAGGVTKPRAADSVNLARVLVDGEQVVVGVGAVGAPAAPAPVGASGGSTGPVDLNTADAAALDALPGIGPVLAERIVSWRQENGRFGSVDELGEVSGIGEAILGRLRSLVRV